MNAHFAFALVVAAAGVAAATTARADDITIDPHPFVSTRTRAEVQEELRQFRQSGVNPWADEYDQLADMRRANSRQQVKAEFLADRDEVAAFGSEDSGSSYMTRVAAARAHRSGIELARTE